MVNVGQQLVNIQSKLVNFGQLWSTLVNSPSCKFTLCQMWSAFMSTLVKVGQHLVNTWSTFGQLWSTLARIGQCVEFPIQISLDSVNLWPALVNVGNLGQHWSTVGQLWSTLVYYRQLLANAQSCGRTSGQHTVTVIWSIRVKLGHPKNILSSRWPLGHCGTLRSTVGQHLVNSVQHSTCRPRLTPRPRHGKGGPNLTCVCIQHANSETLVKVNIWSYLINQFGQPLSTKH